MLWEHIFIVALYLVAGFTFLAIIWSWIVSDFPIVKTRRLFLNKTDQGLLYYNLPETELIVQSDVVVTVFYDKSDGEIKEAKVSELKITISKKTIPDTRYTYSLRYHPTAMHSDEVDFKIENGLLQNANVISEDRTPEVVQELSVTPKEAIPKLQTASTLSPPLSDQDIEVERQTFQKKFTAKARKLIEESSMDLVWQVLIINKNGKADATRDATLELSVLNVENFKKKGDSNTSALVWFDPGNKEYSGVLTRSLKELELQIKLKSNNAFESQSSMVVADVTKAFIVPLKRRSFVKQENAITFNEGFIQSNKVVSPSSYQGFVSIPINILKAVVSIPAQLFSVRLYSLKSRTEIEKEKWALTEALNELRNARVKDELAIEKLKADLEKERLNREEKRMDILNKKSEDKTLKDLKKDLEESKNQINEIIKALKDLKE